MWRAFISRVEKQIAGFVAASVSPGSCSLYCRESAMSLFWLLEPVHVKCKADTRRNETREKDIVDSRQCRRHHRRPSGSPDRSRCPRGVHNERGTAWVSSCLNGKVHRGQLPAEGDNRLTGTLTSFFSPPSAVRRLRKPSSTVQLLLASLACCRTRYELTFFRTKRS